MFSVKTTGQSSWSVSWRCDACGKSGWPLFRLNGYPTPEGWDLVDEGLAVLKGCDINSDDDLHEFECPHCETGVDMPEAYRDEALREI